VHVRSELCPGLWGVSGLRCGGGLAAGLRERSFPSGDLGREQRVREKSGACDSRNGMGSAEAGGEHGCV